MKEIAQSFVCEILGNPIPWKRPGHRGKKCYDQQTKEKVYFQWHLKMNLNPLYPACTALRLVVAYHMPIPKSYSTRRALECLHKPHVYKPDLSNLVKFTEDAFNGMIWKDDAIISEIRAQKFYSIEPKTVFKIEHLGLNVAENE